jgi:RNA polymerase sigma factor (sigma-70 family)
MEAIVRNLPHFRNDCQFTTWLAYIVDSKVSDELRKYLRHNEHCTSLTHLTEANSEREAFEIIAPRTTEHECLIREELREAFYKLQEFVASHKEAERNGMILRLALLDDYAGEEVAQLLGVDRQTVHSIVYRARKYLRDASKDQKNK